MTPSATGPFPSPEASLFGDINLDDVRNMAWPEAVPPGFTQSSRDKAFARRQSTDNL